MVTSQKGLSEPLSLILDPLNAEFDGRDPLSMFAAEAEAENKNQKPSSLKVTLLSNIYFFLMCRLAEIPGVAQD